jgi:nicotinate phosphoribosyltransferase
MNETLPNTPRDNPETERRISDGLDFYKLTMGQVALERFPAAEVTFTMKNRGSEYPLSQYVDTENLKVRFETIAKNGFMPDEIAYFAGLQAQDGTARFDEPYLNYLANLKLNPVDVSLDTKTNDLSVHTTGPWASVSLWETIVMSEINEQYYTGLIEAQGLTTDEVWETGDKRLSQKIAVLKERPDIKFSDFGTRRRFSAAWQDHAIGRLATELPDNFVGTSNPWFAYKHGLTPIGTYAHEMPMVYAALADANDQNPLDGHHNMMADWYERYGDDLSTALTDTFTSKFFFSDFSEQQAKQWKGLRHDSGDPIEFGEAAIEFYKKNHINPATKTLIFSDGLNIDTIITLADHFKDKINILFGWGTTLMNDMGLRANNFVMKATQVNGIDTVKLSDNEGKHTGPRAQVDRYIALKDARTKVTSALELANV